MLIILAPGFVFTALNFLLDLQMGPKSQEAKAKKACQGQILTEPICKL
jgi:hypothetical protein